MGIAQLEDAFETVTHAAKCVTFEEQVEVPLEARSFDVFRKWTVSDRFPDRGRIDYLPGRIEVDMSPEDLFSHGAVKMELIRVLISRVKLEDRGNLFSDRTRVSCPAAGLSVEPDIVFVSHSALESGRVRLVPKAGRGKGRYIEFEGPPDLIVEVVSDSSAGKDTARLPAAYWSAGVREFWLADARNEQLVFQIHDRGETGFKPVTVDAEGFQLSAIMEARYRLDRGESHGNWSFDLIERPVR
jgi:Uma2 family endonuclease